MLSLEIITPSRSLPLLRCTSVVLPGKDGQFEVLPGHAPLMAEIKTGFLSFSVDDSTQDLSPFGTQKDSFRLMVASGFVDVANDRVLVLCDALAFPSEVSAGSEDDLLHLLKERMKYLTEKSHKELRRLGAAIETAITHL